MVSKVESLCLLKMDVYKLSGSGISGTISIQQRTVLNTYPTGLTQVIETKAKKVRVNI